MTLAEVATAINGSKAHLSRIETGEHQLMPGVAAAIAKVFGVSPEMLREARPGEQISVSDEAELLTLFRGATGEQRRAMVEMARIVVSLGAKSDEG